MRCNGELCPLLFKWYVSLIMLCLFFKEGCLLDTRRPPQILEQPHGMSPFLLYSPKRPMLPMLSRSLQLILPLQHKIGEVTMEFLGLHPSNSFLPGDRTTLLPLMDPGLSNRLWGTPSSPASFLQLQASFQGDSRAPAPLH